MKQFSIAHDKVALPVTSDACLFGALIEFPTDSIPMDSPFRVLDVGTGTGLLCFMLAQKYPNAQFTGVDIHLDSIQQAEENRQNNPFSSQIQFELGDILQYCPIAKFDAIVCNPPFFENQLSSSDATRGLARHTSTLNLSHLLAACNRLLVPQGTVFLLYPMGEIMDYSRKLMAEGLCLTEVIYIHPRENKPAHLVVLTAVKLNSKDNDALPIIKSKSVVHYTSNLQLTEVATHYLKDYYIHL
jgi:tRNA1Val (adenine37-N6)-methyltransferase